MTNPNNPNLNDPNRVDNANTSEPNTPVNAEIERTGYQQTIAVLAIIIVAIFVIIFFGYYMYRTNYPIQAIVPQPAIQGTSTVPVTQPAAAETTTTVRETTTVTKTPAQTR